MYMYVITTFQLHVQKTCGLGKYTGASAVKSSEARGDMVTVKLPVRHQILRHGRIHDLRKVHVLVVD